MGGVQVLLGCGEVIISSGVASGLIICEAESSSGRCLSKCVFFALKGLDLVLVAGVSHLIDFSFCVWNQ